MWGNFKPFQALASVCLLASVASAATVTTVGAQTNVGDGWRTPSVAKTFDIDGNNVYGTLGYVLFATHSSTGTHGPGHAGTGQQGTPFLPSNTINVMPSYLTVGSAGGFDTTYLADYTLIDDPANPGGPDLYSGIGYKGAGFSGNAEYAMFSLTFGAAIPAGQTFRIGLFVGNVGPSTGDPVSLRIAGTGLTTGNSGQFARSQVQQINHYVFFDLAGVAPNDTFTVYGTTSNPSSGLSFGGLTVDSVPEPTTAVLLLAPIALLRRRRR